jgi:hypothetical protein
MVTTERIYSITFKAVSVGTAVQDLFSLRAGTSAGVLIRRISLSASNVTTPLELPIRLKRLPVTVTPGSAGSAPTIQKVSSVNPWTSFIAGARCNDTTQATTSGTAQELANWNWNYLQDFLEVPPSLEERWECAASEALVVDLSAVLTASVTMTGTIVWVDS